MLFDNIDVSVSKKQGNLGVARAIYEYTRLGYTVLAPLSDSDKYDLVIDDGESLKRVQVKTSRCKNKAETGYIVNLATGGGNTQTNTRRNRHDGDYDLLFVLLETGRAWSIPVHAIAARKCTLVGTEGPQALYTEYEIK